MKKLTAIILFVAAVASAAPRLRLADTTVGPVSFAQGQNGPTRTVEAANDGDGALNLTLTSSASWAVPTAGPNRPCALSGNVCTPINIALQTSGLAKGSYTAFITVSDPNAIDAPQTIAVISQAGGGVPDKVDFYLPPITGAREKVSFSTNGILTGTPATASGGNWLSLALDGSGSFAFAIAQSITATNVNGLSEGLYNGQITISGSPVATENKVVPATLRITSQPIVSVSPAILRIRGAQGGPKRVAYLSVANRGVAGLTLADPTVTVSSGQTWLSAVRTNNNLVTVTADTGALSPGSYTASVVVNSNAVNGAQTIPMEFEVVARGAPTLSVGGVVNNATFESNDALAQGAIAAVFGEQLLVAEPGGATEVPLPVSLNALRVLVNGVAAPLYYISYDQVNFQVPFETAVGPATVVVERDGQRSNPVAVQIAGRAPRLLRLGIGDYGIMINQDGTFPIPANLPLNGHPAKAGDVLVIYCIGLGPTTPTVATGAGAPLAPLAQVDPRPLAIFGGASIAPGEAVTAQFAGLAPNFVGLYQVNAQVPADSQKGGNVSFFLFQNGLLSNRVELAIE